MLKSLKVRNYALIEDALIEFDEGLNVITGETGAGKTILIKALGLVIGQRADTSVLRVQEKKCVVEAVFDMHGLGLQAFFNKHDLDYEEQSILRREINVSGKSRSFINDTPVNLKTLETLGSAIIEVHSQHDSLLIFKTSYQFRFLDALGGTLELKSLYHSLYQTLEDKKSELEALREQDLLNRQQNDFNQFLYDELNEANLEEGEEEQLSNEQEMLENAEDLIRSFTSAESLLNGLDHSVRDQLAELQSLMESNKTEFTNSLSQRIRGLLLELDDIASDISRAADNISIDPERLEVVNQRLGLIFNLKQKHRANSDSDLFEIRSKLANRLNQSDEIIQAIKALSGEIETLESEVKTMAEELHTQRHEAIPGIESEINRSLEELGMQHSRFRVSLERLSEPGPNAYSELRFELSSDKGLNFSDLKTSASGGELSRIHLCLKNSLAKKQRLASSIFDEIDSGVSGEVAHKVGAKLLEMAESQQIIAITHLVQIASLGKKHFHISKSDEHGKVRTEVRLLAQDERVHEIARMISGSNLTESALEQSRTLMKFK